MPHKATWGVEPQLGTVLLSQAVCPLQSQTSMRHVSRGPAMVTSVVGHCLSPHHRHTPHLTPVSIVHGCSSVSHWGRRNGARVDGRTDRNAAQHCGAHFQLRDGQAASSSAREGREEWDNLPNNDARAATLGTVHARFQ